MASIRPTGWASNLTNLDIPENVQDAQYIKGKIFRLIILKNRIAGKTKAKKIATELGVNSNQKSVGGNSINSLFHRSKSMSYTSDGKDLAGTIARSEVIPQETVDLEVTNQPEIDREKYSKNTKSKYKPGRSSNVDGLNKTITLLGVGNTRNQKRFIPIKKTNGLPNLNGNSGIKFYFFGNGVDSKYSVLELQFTPREIQFTPENKLIPIATPGRNTPIYHYTGSEDTLEFSIDWVSMNINNDKRDVIEKCRWLEAMSKNDGYINKPAILMIQWGTEGTLFNGLKWVIEKAPYKLQNFNRGFKDVNGNFNSTSLLPIQAYQQITLKRIDEVNTSRSNLLYVGDHLPSV